MDTLKQNTIENYNREIARLEKMRDAVALLPDGLEALGANIYGHGSHGLRFDMPMTATAFKQVRKLLGADWRREGHEWTDNDGDQYKSFRHKQTGVGLTVCIRVSMKGATCERRQVGVKEVPVYEVVCNG